jgi:DNA-directed RNA polymerase specialized sigma24 family protein
MNKDKKIIDRYMQKHPNASPEKIKKYAEKKGIYIDVMPIIEHKKLKDKISKELGLDDLDLDKEEDRKRLWDAVNKLPEDKKQEFLDMKNH